MTANQPEVNTSFLAVAPSQGQGLFARLNTRRLGSDEAVETEGETPVAQGQVQGPTQSVAPWVRSVLGVEERFQQIREMNHDTLFENKSRPTPATPRRRTRAILSRVAGCRSQHRRSLRSGHRVQLGSISHPFDLMAARELPGPGSAGRAAFPEW